MIKDLIKIANSLDSKGYSKEADQLDAIINKIAAITNEEYALNITLDYIGDLTINDFTDLDALTSRIRTMLSSAPDATWNDDELKRVMRKQGKVESLLHKINRCIMLHAMINQPNEVRTSPWFGNEKFKDVFTTDYSTKEKISDEAADSYYQVISKGNEDFYSELGNNRLKELMAEEFLKTTGCLKEINLLTRFLGEARNPYQ